MLDTSVVRRFASDSLSVDAFVAYAKEGGSVHVADGAVVELCKQLHVGGLAWEHWLRARLALDEVLDFDRPILLGGRELLASVGVTIETTQPVHSEESLLAASRAAWHQLRNAETLEQLGRPLPGDPTPAPGQLVHLQTSLATKIVESEKDAWVELFAQVRAKAIEARAREAHPLKSTFERVVVELGAYLDTLVTSPGRPASVRLDALIRVYALWSERAMQPKAQYNARKRANDVFDLELLRYLALPAAVCAVDAALVTSLADANAWQRAWVVTPDELGDPDRRRALLGLRWPG